MFEFLMIFLFFFGIGAVIGLVYGLIKSAPIIFTIVTDIFTIILKVASGLIRFFVSTCSFLLSIFKQLFSAVSKGWKEGKQEAYETISKGDRQR
ncbi:MAG: hypothetical protein FH756_02370 [Firmicutes bacterium]|nr:hypothetical protein [Bacillota bacterium]